MQLLCFITILISSLGQLPAILGEDLGSISSSGISSSSISSSSSSSGPSVGNANVGGSSGSLLNNNNNINKNMNMNVNSTILNTIINSVGGNKGGSVGTLGGVINTGMGLNALSGVNIGGSSGIAATQGNMGVGTAGTQTTHTSHGHALAGLANFGIVVPGLPGAGSRMHPAMGIGNPHSAGTSDMSYGIGQNPY